MLLYGTPEVVGEVVGLEGSFGEQLFAGEGLREVEFLIDAAAGVVVEELLADRRDRLLVLLIALARDLGDCALADALAVARVEGTVLGGCPLVRERIVSYLPGEVEQAVLGVADVVPQRVAAVPGGGPEELVEVVLVLHPLSIIL